MPLATKNGSLVVKDGLLAENCGCCGGWYCYCPSPPCDFYDVLNLTDADAVQVTIEGVGGNVGAVSDGFNGIFNNRVLGKPGVALNTTFVCLKHPYENIFFDESGTTYKFLYVNSGAPWSDRAGTLQPPAYYNFVVREQRRLSSLLGKTVLSASLLVPGTWSNSTFPVPLTAMKAVDSCAFQTSEEIIFDANDGDFGTSFSGDNLPPNNKVWQSIFNGTALLGFNNAALYGYDLRYARFRVRLVPSQPQITDKRSWWFATPFGSGASTNQPPSTIKVTIADTTSAKAGSFAGEYTLNLGTYASSVASDGTVISGADHGSYYSASVLKGPGQRYVFVDARPSLVSVGGQPHVAWGVSVNEQPKVSGWYGGDGFGSTTPVAWGNNTSGTLNGNGFIASYIGGGTFSIKIEL
jgi:hypothetical protein